MHSVGRRDVESSVALLCGLSVDWAERYMHEGRISQDEFEGYMHAWSSFHPHSSVSWAGGDVESAVVTAIAVGLVDLFTPVSVTA